MDSSAASMDPNLLERESELSALDQALAAAVEGARSVRRRRGAAGIGKSSLVNACIELRKRATCTRSRCARTQLERAIRTASCARRPTRSRSTSPTRSAPRSSPGRATRAADPGSGQRRGAGQPRAHVPAPTRPLLAHGEPRPPAPLLISIDDAQWADEASLAAERFLSMRIADLPMVLLLGRSQTAEVGQLERSARRAPRGSGDGPDPCGPAVRPTGAEERIEALLGSADAAFAAACHHATGGDPFLLEQLVSEVREEGIEPRAASAERVASLGPDTMRASVLLRLERLPRRRARWRAPGDTRRARRVAEGRGDAGRRARGRRR